MTPTELGMMVWKLLAGTFADAGAAVDDPWSAYQNGGLSVVALSWLRQELAR